MYRFLIVLLLCAAGSVRAEVPITGRTQTLSYSEQEVHDLAAETYRKIISQHSQKNALDRDPELLKRSCTIAARIITQAIKLKPEISHWEWELHLTSGPEISAFSLAGGKLLLGARFVEVAKLSDDELAIVLGHEVAHIIAEHGREQASALWVNAKKPSLRQAIADMPSDLSYYLSEVLPLSQIHELEADRIGIMLAAMAGFKPAAALRFYRKLTLLENAHGTKSASDPHSAGEHRERLAARVLPEANELYAGSSFNRDLIEFTFR